VEAQIHERYRFGLYEVDLSARALYKRGVNVHLQGKPFLLLSMLLQRPGEVVTREELRNSLWAADTFVEFNDGVNTAIGKLRSALGDSAEQPAFIETVRGRGYRFIATVAKEEDKDAWQERRFDSPKAEKIAPLPSPKTSRPMVLATVILCLLIVGTMVALLHKRWISSVSLTEKDTLLVAEFANSTGDPIFDDSLREALTTQLEQSPYLSLVPVRTVQETLSHSSQSRIHGLRQRLIHKSIRRGKQKSRQLWLDSESRLSLESRPAPLAAESRTSNQITASSQLKT